MRPKGIRVDTEPLEEAEYQAIIDQLKKEHWRLLAEVMWETGVRVNEALALLKTDLITEECGAWVTREKRKPPIRDFLPLSPSLFDRLYAYCHNAHRLTVFPEGSTSNGAWRAIKIACERAGIRTSIHPHSFRHGFGHRVDRAGLPETIRQRMMGHASAASTRIYSKATKSETVEAFRALNRGDNGQTLL